MTTQNQTPSTPPAFSNGDLKDACFRVLQGEPFYAAVSRYVEKRENFRIPTARVFIDRSGHFILEYNPKFFASLSMKHVVGVLRHELQHIVLGHLTKRYHDVAESDRKFWNIATDLAINSMIGKDSLPDGCLFPGDGEYKDMPGDLAAEHYLSLVRKNHQDGKDDGSDHSGWEKVPSDAAPGGEGGDQPEDGDMDDGRREVAEKRIKDIISKAINEVAASSQGWGSISDDLRKQIMERVRTVVDWRKVLRFFVHATQRADKVNSIRRINKRFPYIHPGRKIVRHANIAVSIDQSGSVSDELLVTFFSELEKLSAIAQFTVVPFDTDVNDKDVFVWKKGQRIKAERVACGGTDFNAPTRWVNERNFDGHIICTDMEAPLPIRSKCKRLWATTREMAERGHCQPKGERVIHVVVPTQQS